MARINYVSITLCALLFTTLSLTPMTHASKRARESSATTHITKKTDKEKNTATTKKVQKTAKEAASRSATKGKTASSVRKSFITASKNAKTHSRHAVNRTASASSTERCTERRGYKSYCVEIKDAASGTLADAHKTKVQKATKVAMSKLTQQVGKSYRWGGSSPRADFDCDGLVYYACKDLVKICIPRTTNEMYRLRDATPIKRSELKNNDLVFFHTQGHDTVDHVGVYVGNGKFIQSPRTGQRIRITSLSEDC